MGEFRRARRGVFQGCGLVSTRSEKPEPKKQNPSTKERSFTELRYASFRRSIVRDPGILSRVQMNALAGALDSLPGSEGDVCKFSS
jgi:hypothetical protein